MIFNEKYTRHMRLEYRRHSAGVRNVGLSDTRKCKGL